jgi:hypothetical protein
MYNEDQYLELHRNMAIEHPQLQHVDGVNVAWIGADEGEDKLYTKTLSPWVMRMLLPQGKFVGDGDFLQDRMTVGFSISGKVKGSAQVDYREAERVRSQAMLIGKQIVLRLLAYANADLEDEHTECACCLAGMDGSSITYTPVQEADNYTGYLFRYTIGSGEILEYNPNDWI